MRAVGWMQPRDHVHAPQVIAMLLRISALVTAAATLVGWVADPRTDGTIVVLAVMAVLLVVAQRAPHWGDRHPTVWAVVPPAAVGVLIGVDR